MCLTFFYINKSAADTTNPYNFIQAFNREESFDRPNQQLGFWEEDPNILAGRDLQAKGTWLGVNIKTGNIAFLTNIPPWLMKSAPKTKNSQSRGNLVSDFLQTDFFEKYLSNDEKDNEGKGVKYAMEKYLNNILKIKEEYGGFHLFSGNLKTLDFMYINNNEPENTIVVLKEGIYPLANCNFSEKCERVLEKLDLYDDLISTISKSSLQRDEIISKLNQIMTKSSEVKCGKTEKILTKEQREQILAAFPSWGTKSTSLILVDSQGKLTFVETSFNKGGIEQNVVIKEAEF